MAEYKNIPVSPEIHKQVKKIAKKHRRGLGAQAELWLEEALAREERNNNTHDQEQKDNGGEHAQA